MKIIIADDHDLVRDGLCALIRRDNTAGEVLPAKSLSEATQIMQSRGDIDVTVLDLYMPGMNGAAAATRLAADFPSSKIVLMSGIAAGVEVTRAIRDGVSGFIPKTLSGDAFVAALRLVACGEKYIPADMLLGEGQKQAGISEREQQILAQLRLGFTNKAIAQRLGVEEMVVKSTLRAVGVRLGARTRTEIALKSLQLAE